MTRRDWLRRLAAAGAAGVVPGSDLPPTLTTAMGDRAAWLREALPTSPAEPRRLRAYDLRVKAAFAAASANIPRRDGATDETRVPAYLAMFTKGLPHDAFGLVDPEAYRLLARAAAGAREARFEDVPLGGTRRLVSPQAAFAFALDGLDAAMLEAPPPPAWESAAYATEAIETYWMALLRDVPFGAYGDDPLVARAVSDLSRSGRNVTPRTLFGRRPTPDAPRRTPDSRLPGPVVSQFLLRAVPMGAQLLSPRVPAQAPGESFLATWDEWLASQNGHLPSREATYAGRRFICCGRDLATWTRTDYPGQAGVQAALLLEAMRAPVTPQHPYVRSRNQAGYVTFGLPFIVDLASRVAMHALRASWFQKWVLHRRLRPEELGGRLEAGAAGAPIVAWPDTRFVQSDAFAEMRRRTGTCLLPMAWPEGAPLHPAYPSAHAATAGAMVTVLKAYYAEEWVMPDVVEPSLDGSDVRPIDASLTVGDELDKLAWNLAIGRAFAGVQWRSDAEAGLSLGETVAVALLRELRELLPEPHGAFTLRAFDGNTIEI
ncbi:PAP2 superfamily protein [Luteitalea pratensis]|uniref:PAP2 superfamily protein n=1 Tax=Luteitalea pratensis TaxID=1855912 RepID=A0A143PXF5_LUTPR|nr:vanadium-dependent haloperoxidase [Luteitalea pratensis]AMY12898.1 PAP2 superfamily protein [Luteitalea pratensis]